MAKEGLTPMMKQFYDLKAKHPDAIMLFRCGDFYETYCEDAVVASEILGITLTKRSNGGRNGEPVASLTMPWIRICLNSSGQGGVWPFATSWKTLS